MDKIGEFLILDVISDILDVISLNISCESLKSASNKGISSDVTNNVCPE